MVSLMGGSSKNFLPEDNMNMLYLYLLSFY